MGQICNISFSPFFLNVKLGKKNPKMAKIAAANEPTAAQKCLWIWRTKKPIKKNHIKEFGGRNAPELSQGKTRDVPGTLRGPAAILLISRDTFSDSIAKLFRACFPGVSHKHRAIYVLQNGVSH